MIPKLILFGLWEDRNGAHPWIHPREIAGFNWTSDQKSKILRYLKNGVRIRGYLGYSWCRLDETVPDAEMGNADLSDGTYVWPEGLAYYLERFDVELPQDFVSHVAENDYTIDDSLKSLSEDDFDDVEYDSKPWEQRTLTKSRKNCKRE